MANAGPGQGSVYHRPDGRWSATVSEGGGKRKTLYAGTEREARRKLNLRLREQAAGLPPTDDRLRNLSTPLRHLALENH